MAVDGKHSSTMAAPMNEDTSPPTNMRPPAVPRYECWDGFDRLAEEDVAPPKPALALPRPEPVA